MNATGTLTCPKCGTETSWPNRCDCTKEQTDKDDESVDLMAALKAKLPQGVPVVWRWKNPKHPIPQAWAYGEAPPRGLGVGDLVVEPLYAAQSATLALTTQPCDLCKGKGVVAVRAAGTHDPNYGRINYWRCNCDGTISEQQP